MGFKTGIVGLPNVGKSTLFNLINYEFEPTSGTVTAPKNIKSPGQLKLHYSPGIPVQMNKKSITKNQALIFGISSSLISIIVLYIFSNLVAAITLAITILFYVFVYTILNILLQI